MRNQPLLDRARNALIGATPAFSNRLEELIESYEMADYLSNVPIEYLEGKSARVRGQVLARVAHWEIRKLDVEKEMNRVLRHTE